MPRFTILSRVDSYSDYLTEVEADTAQEAVDYAYEVGGLEWRHEGVVEFDARRMVALDHNGEEIEATARGKG